MLVGLGWFGLVPPVSVARGGRVFWLWCGALRFLVWFGLVLVGLVLVGLVWFGLVCWLVWVGLVFVSVLRCAVER